MTTDPDFLSDPMIVPGQLELLGDDCPPRGLERPVDHEVDLVTQQIRSEFRQLQQLAATWAPDPSRLF